MPTTPVTFPAPSEVSSSLGAGGGAADTERPPPPDAAGSATESTTIGRPPDLSVVGPPSPQALRAALPVPPTSGHPSRPRLAAAPMPTRSVAAVPRGMSVAGTTPRTADGDLATYPMGERTALGIAPIPGHLATAIGPGLPPPTPAAARLDPGPAPPTTRAYPARGNENAAPLTRRCATCQGLYPTDFLVCPRDATPLVQADSDADPLIGAQFGETYQIVRTIGEGGMGRVYEARHLRLKERRFAVKCMHADLARNPEMAARFLREAESASSIKHPNVVDVFDVHHLADGTPYLVGEYLEGEELADYVAQRGPLEPRLAAKVTRQVCHALVAAHARGIVHRDMKPENIFVLASSIAAVERNESKTLHVKVLDFGISKAGHGDTSHLTRTGVIMGTPSYMSPEQARGQAVDHRADVYSVGACLYFMVTGRRPFDSDDPTSTLSMVLTQDPMRPRQLDPRIPETLELVIQRAMAKEADERYATMADLEKALAVFTGQAALGLQSGSLVPLSIASPEIRVGGAERALDVARAMLAPSGGTPRESSSLARTARPTIILASGTVGAWLIGGAVAALAGLVRVLHDGEITLTESLLLVVGCLFAAATPIALYVMHLHRVIWPNSVRALQLASDLKRVCVSALATYGSLALLGRIVHTVLARNSRGLASGLWDIVLFVTSIAVALSVGGFASLLKNLRRRTSSRS